MSYTGAGRHNGHTGIAEVFVKHATPWQVFADMIYEIKSVGEGMKDIQMSVLHVS